MRSKNVHLYIEHVLLAVSQVQAEGAASSYVSTPLKCAEFLQLFPLQPSSANTGEFVEWSHHFDLWACWFYSEKNYENLTNYYYYYDTIDSNNN